MSSTPIALQPVIMAGGSGTRLWPLSRAGFPKQFLVLSGNSSLFQQTTSRLQGLATADIAVAVDPSSGRDSPDCNVALPCRTVEYALHQRQATNVLLLRGTFTETSIRVDGSAPFLSIGSRDGSAFDCGGGGPAFSKRAFGRSPFSGSPFDRSPFGGSPFGGRA